MKVRQAEPPPRTQCRPSVFVTGSGPEGIKGVGLGGGRVPEKEEV